MPLYDYSCAACGDFRLLRPMAKRNAPARCPDCQQTATRQILAPALALMNPARRKAFATNEKSRHEPRVSQAHSCGSGCGCGPGSSIKPKRQKKTKLGTLQSGKATSRPWMLGH
jgi:putative FmdB family regulatory protein